MELRLSLAPADLNRFRRQSVLRAYLQGRPRNRVERGLIGDGEDARPYRLNRSTYPLAGGTWTAELIVSHGELGETPFCFADIRLLTGPGDPLCALFEAMAQAVPFAVSRLDLPLLLPGRLPVSIKGKPPPLDAGMSAAEAFGQIAASAFAISTAAPDQVPVVMSRTK